MLVFTCTQCDFFVYWWIPWMLLNKCFIKCFGYLKKNDWYFQFCFFFEENSLFLVINFFTVFSEYLVTFRNCYIDSVTLSISLFMFHFYFLQSTVHLIHFIYHSPSCSYLPYLAALILHVHSTLLWVSLFRQPGLWKLTTYECL